MSKNAYINDEYVNDNRELHPITNKEYIAGLVPWALLVLYLLIGGLLLWLA